MTINSLDVQPKQFGSSSRATEGIPGFLDTCRGALPVRCSGMFATVKEYFWPAPPPTVMHAQHALATHAIDVESANALDSEQESCYHSTIKHVVFIAAVAGIGVATYLVHSALSAYGGDVVEPDFATPEALSAALATTALIGRRLLSAPTVVNAIANQSVFANAPFNLQIDLHQVFNYSGNLADVRCFQADGTPLPSWLTMAMNPAGMIFTPVGQVTISQIPSGSFSLGVTVVGNYAYIVDSYSGLKIIDITRKTSPTLIGNISISQAYDLSVVGNYAYVVDLLSGLKIIDITSKTSPTIVGSVATSNAYGVAVVGNYAYIAACGELDIIDVTSKTSPILVGSVVTSCSRQVTVVGNYAYIADSNNGFNIIDVTSKTSPTLTGSVASSYASGVSVVGNYAYVTDLDGLKIIDITSKTCPTLVGIATTNGAFGVTVVGDYAYLADLTGGLKVYSVSSKTSPILIKTLATNAHKVIVVDDYAYVVVTNCVAPFSSLKIFSSSKISLSGTPEPLNRGALSIKLTITDALGETTSAYFPLTILNHPPIAPTIEPRTVHHAFDWIIPAFSDSDGDSLTYSATLADGSPLPGWVSFNSPTRTLFGVVPPIVTFKQINIQADDSYGGIINAIQTIIIVNAPPTAGPLALPNQNVKPMVPFNFSVDSNVFIDPDGDPLTYSAALANQQPLPNWLTFNQTSKIFTVIAPRESASSMSVIVTATDIFEATAERSFDLNIIGSTNNSPPQKIRNPPDYSVGVNKAIAFQIGNDTFFDPDQDPLTYSASTTGGSRLPVWINFDGDTRFFYGTAPNTPQILPINVQVEDWQHSSATANFNLFVEGAPQVITPLSNLPANVGTTFKFIVPENTFQNLCIQGALSYSAALTIGAALPAWLTFDPATRTFTGTPGRKDTDAFSSRPLPIRLTVRNNIGTAAVDFMITVQGESNATLAIKIISSVGATVAIFGTAYAKRNSVWKKSMKCVYRRPTECVVFGQESEYCHAVTRLNPENVASVQLLRDGQSLPGGVIRFDWLIYDTSTAKITIDAAKLKEQEGLLSSRWTIQVKNKRGWVNDLVWEEFDIGFVHQFSNTNVDDELRDTRSSIAMRPTQSRHKQLLQPLISTQ